MTWGCYLSLPGIFLQSHIPRFVLRCVFIRHKPQLELSDGAAK